MGEKRLYPMKFIPIFKERIWGGNRIKTVLGLDPGEMPACGEAWMLSGLEDDDSVVANGFLEGNTLSELTEVYMGDLVGEAVYQRFGCQFPLLFKWIDAETDLPVQVHPDDALAMEREGCLGKTEMWFVREARPGSRLICDFKDGVTKDVYLRALQDHRIERVLQPYKVQEGEAYYLPAGTVHALGAGLLVAEIQQSSDITYRIYDWDRKDSAGKERPLHVVEAMEALTFPGQAEAHEHHDHCGCGHDHGHEDGQGHEGGRGGIEPPAGPIRYRRQLNRSQTLLDGPHFHTGYIGLTAAIEKDLSDIDSFVVYMCTAGQAVLKADGQMVEIGMGELVLLPATTDRVTLYPDVKGCELLEVYMPVEPERPSGAAHAGSPDPAAGWLNG